MEPDVCDDRDLSRHVRRGKLRARRAGQSGSDVCQLRRQRSGPSVGDRGEHTGRHLHS